MSTRTNASASTNLLLDGLPSKDRQQLLSLSERVDLVFGNIIYEPGEVISHVYFPTDSFISLILPIEGGASLEVGLVGSEGMYGSPVMLGVDISQFLTRAQGSGPALRIATPLFLRELDLSSALRRKMKRYLYVTMKQLAQTAACNRFHLVEERLARWLLMTQDRAHADEFHVTQQFLAQMLGVRRVGVTKAAGSLQHKKLISYSRGDIKIHDTIGLEAASCRCYRADKEIYDRILHS
ncbi:MAG: Crp/Fnr family transcriptional regulator [Methylophilaceae bacterium]